MQKAIKYIIFKTKWGYFGLAGRKYGLLRAHLPLADAEKVRSHLLKNIQAAQCDKTFFKTLQQQITAYFDGAYINFSRDIPLEPTGLTRFTKLVLTACRDIRFGQTISYSQLAKRIGRANSARAIGGALARNPLPLIIPCHRVICSDGKIGGFSATGGTNLKAKLLELEQQVIRDRKSN